MHETFPVPAYNHLVERLNRFPQGAPPSESLFQILKILFSEQEAELVAQLPIKPFTLKQASRIWKMDSASARNVLDGLCSRAILLDSEGPDGQTTYVLPPPMAGFFEFSMMRLRGDVDQKLLGKLLYQYCNVEEDFVHSLFTRGETQLGRIFVYESAIPETTVLDYERASEIIRSASHRGVGVCYCRHKMETVGRDCQAPKEICLTLNNTAYSLAKAGYAREVDAVEGLDLLQQARDHHLVQFGENERQGVNFICNCCSCCCEALIAARRFGHMRPVHTTNFIPRLEVGSCTGCGKCVNACPVEALALVSANDPHQPGRKVVKLDEDACLGCGVCVHTCARSVIHLEARAERVITPLNSTHRVVVMAIERGMLQNLIFDNHVLWSQRALSAFLGAILKLPPARQIMASKQMKSRYLEALITKLNI